MRYKLETKSRLNQEKSKSLRAFSRVNKGTLIALKKAGGIQRL